MLANMYIYIYIYIHRFIPFNTYFDVPAVSLIAHCVQLIDAQNLSSLASAAMCSKTQPPGDSHAHSETKESDTDTWQYAVWHVCVYLSHSLFHVGMCICVCACMCVFHCSICAFYSVCVFCSLQLLQYMCLLLCLSSPTLVFFCFLYVYFLYSNGMFGLFICLSAALGRLEGCV